MSRREGRELENVVARVSDLIGRTPLFELCSTGAGSRLLLKLEQLNPTGSAKVRMAQQMLNIGELRGQLRPGGHVIEPTSGNTGLGLALISIERGYRFTAVVDHHASKEKLRAMAALGTELVYVGAEGTNSPLAVERRRVAAELAAAESGTYRPDQHNNPGNAEGYRELGRELLADLFGDVDYLVSAIGTGGSLCGTVREMRRLGSRVKAVGVEPKGSIIFGGCSGRYWQTGSGSPAGFPVGSNVDLSLIDEGVQVTDVDAFAAARVLARRTGLLIGGSSGGAVHVALQRLSTLPAGSTIVVIVSDAGEKYLDTVFDDDWMAERGLLDPVAEQQVRYLIDTYAAAEPIPRSPVSQTDSLR
ncbi:PLP-dependent cysteine synthase family protein [Streptomyces sp. NPDC127051]|uniref:PLP-dependent cysteine synthase family protein n=1 Tax=Streptomyces sp. NPDC127051 TaxID=3347119 RepID=UPI00364E32D8